MKATLNILKQRFKVTLTPFRKSFQRFLGSDSTTKPAALRRLRLVGLTLMPGRPRPPSPQRPPAPAAPEADVSNDPSVNPPPEEAGAPAAPPCLSSSSSSRRCVSALLRSVCDGPGGAAAAEVEVALVFRPRRRPSTCTACALLTLASAPAHAAVADDEDEEEGTVAFYDHRHQVHAAARSARFTQNCSTMFAFRTREPAARSPPAALWAALLSLTDEVVSALAPHTLACICLAFSRRAVCAAVSRSEKGPVDSARL